ncbi:MAG: nuclear transport factor 2 family protein [Gammaproteobacteria bacterium]
MRHRFAGLALAIAVAAFGVAPSAGFSADGAATDLQARLNRLEAEVTAAEDLSALKRLQRSYGFYLDKGMWEDLQAFFTDDAVANYPAGIYVGHESIREHLFLNVGGRNGAIGLGNNRLYDHMQLQPVVHLDAGGKTAKGRWRALAMFGSLGGGATWAEGVYELQYVKVKGVWKISKLDYYAGFGAPYATGWAAPAASGGPPGASATSGATASAAPARRARNLPHPFDRERKMDCDGFPAACLTPFHYENPGSTLSGATVWDASTMLASVKGGGDAKKRAANLLHRAELLKAEQDVENLQRIYGYYIDRAMWDQAADLFATDATFETGQQGVYVGKRRVREFLGTLGPNGLVEGWMNDHIQLQPLVDVSADGNTARVRSRELAMTGRIGGQGFWSEGVYENTFVRDNGVWKIESLHFYPTFITDYDKGWGKDAQPVPVASAQLPPDRPPTETYAIYPKPHVPPYHFRNPVTGKAPTYPTEEDGGPTKQLAAAALMPANVRYAPPKVTDVNATVVEAERVVERVKDFHALDNLQSAYGYYLDKNLWNNLADLFARDGSMELAQRGVYKGPRVREFLVKVFGRGQEGPVANRLGNHLQLQPVIHVSEDGKTAKIRSRMVQQMSFGPRASMGGAIYENEAVKEDGVWKLSRDHAYNTFSANYDGGWTKVTASNVPGPSKDFAPDSPPSLVFDMFPSVYNIPFHYANPVTGRTDVPAIKENTRMKVAVAAPGKMPPDIAAAVREIGAKIDGRKTGELYAPLQPKEPYRNVTLTRDIHYGPHERHVLDLFVSPGTTAKSAKPVVVFIHGGGFAGGAKNTPGSPFYDNVGLWAASHGLVGVTINYRLAPQFPYPAGVEDLTRLVTWLKANIRAKGGDPKKIFLWGHSAGAAHTGDYLAAMANKGKNPGIAGAILTSGFYVLGDTVSVWKAYYGEDVSKYKERSSLDGIVKSKVPLLIADAELDPDTFKPESERLAAALAKAGKPATRVKLAGHSHISELYAVNTADDSLSGPVLKFIKELE